MSCKICGSGACASYMHSAEEIREHSSVEELSEDQLRRELIEARREIAELKSTIDELKDPCTH